MPIFYYGKDPRAGKNQMPDGLYLKEAAPRNGHPCAKPTNAWTWLTNKASLPNDLILDPFLGSGTTAYCAKKLNRKCIGIEIEEKYCEIAAKRCSQSVMRVEV
uniref:Putative methyltransferase n=1 Tax=viral metagenome TaxID=1070528 RepID=A0A6M3LE78_9ZZZZ